MARYRRQPAVLLTAIAVLAVACGGTGGAGTDSSAPACPTGDPLLGIYDPTRLEVLAECRWFSGTVVEVEGRDDGDLHIRMSPDDDMTSFLNVGNVNTGGMVVEIVPGQALPAPQVGESIRVFGTWVYDTHNDWNEMHPVWAITYGDGSTVAALPPSEPLYAGDERD